MKMMDEQTRSLNEKLQKIYSDPKDPGSFGGVARLLKSAHDKGFKEITSAQVKNFLQSVDAYTLHKQVRKRYLRNKTVVGGIDHQWQADLADLNDVTRYNDGYRYLMTVIDCFSKFAWVIPVKRKDAPSILDAFKKLFFDAAPRKPKRLQTDKGKEFLNQTVLNYLESNGVKHFTTNSDTKAAMVERFNRTLKTKMFTYFTANNTHKYIDVLPDLVSSYNTSVHRTIGMKPSEVRPVHENKIWNRIYGVAAASNTMHKKQINPDSLVRISKTKATFDKGYLPNWTEELFKVTGSLPHPRRVYKLKDFADEEIAGSFYPEEVQVVKKGTDDIFLVEKVLKERKVPGGKELFVKWKGWPNKFNSWIKEKDVTRRW